MDLVDESFVADLDAAPDETPTEPEPTSAPEGDEAKDDKPEKAEGKEPTSDADAKGDDDDPEEWKQLRESKYPNLRTEKEVKAALAKSYIELQNASGKARRDELREEVRELKQIVSNLAKGGQKDEPPQPTPELQVIEEEIESLRDEGRRTTARIQEIEQGWSKREREIGKLEVRYESADDLEKPNIKSELRDAQREHDSLAKERERLKGREIPRLLKELRAKDTEYKRTVRDLEGERERQRQAEADRLDRDERTREGFDTHVETLATKTYKLPEGDVRKDFAYFTTAATVLDLKNRPPDSPAIDLTRLSEHYASRLERYVQRRIQMEKRAATTPKPSPSGPARTASGQFRQPEKPAKPLSRDEMLRAEEERKSKAREGLGEFFKKQQRVKVS